MNIHVRQLDQQSLFWFNQQLTTIEAAIKAREYPEKMWDKLIPIDTSANPLSKTVTYRSSDRVGKAKFGHNMQSDAIPRVGVSRAQHEVSVYEGVVGYGYSMLEIMQAQAAGIPLQSDLAIAARDAYEDEMEDLALLGWGDVFDGFLDLPGVTIMPAPDGAAVGTDTKWTAKTADEMVADCFALLEGVHSSTNTVETADTLVLSSERFLLLARTRMPNAEQLTALEWVKLKNPLTQKTGQALNIVVLRQLSAAGAGGVQRMIAYRKHPDVIRLHLVKTLDFLAPQLVGFNYDVNGWWRSGGVNLRRPGAFRYMDGI